MQLSHESYRTRWLVLVSVWVLTAYAIFSQAAIVRDYLTTTGALGLRGNQVSAAPLKRAYPAFAADALVWVRHSLALIEGKDLRLRHTNIDNAPEGREVHWNSAWAWCIAGAGQLHHLFTGYPIEYSVECATLWLNPTAQLALLILLSAWATKRGGVILGVVVAVAMAFHDRMYEGFFPSYVDHHGLLMVSVLGLMLGALFMGGGWWKPATAGKTHALPDSSEKARSAAVFSAFAGACGLWVSAASVIPPIALIGIAGLLATITQGRSAQTQGYAFDAQVWRLWGRVGAAFSFFFYLLEYFPQHMGVRLEPNHPLHALAWLGGGELVALVSERWLARPESRLANLRQFIWPILAVCAAPVTIVMGGARVFVVLDPFMSHLHNDYIQEFLPLWRTFQGFDNNTVFQVAGLGSLPIIASIATLSYRRREAPIVLWFATFAAALLIAMAIWQSRWLLNAAAVQVCLAIILLVVWTAPLQLSLRWISALAMVGILFVPGAYLRYKGASDQLRARQISPKDAAACLNRDIAAALRSTQPTGDITLLSSPNSSTGIGYYGRFKTLGTLYWENSAGLKAAASILGAKTEEEAAKLIQKHKVTHIALLMEENFIVEYYRLLNPGATDDEVRKCFGYRLLYDRVVPVWLQMIPYAVPADLVSLKPTLMLFKVNFQQTMPEAVYNVSKAQVAAGAIDDGERTLDGLLKQWPQFYEPWLSKGELLIARKAWVEAADAMLKGISLAGPNLRPGLYGVAAKALYDQGQHALAIRIYRTALAEQPTSDLASYLAWILATSKVDSVRNGQEALDLIQQALKAQPNTPSYLSVLSGALAELGRFPEAIDAADRALTNGRLRNDSATQVYAERLEILKSGKLLRF
jgi:tetratricopeptide (TPR) repeat protein